MDNNMKEDQRENDAVALKTDGNLGPRAQTSLTVNTWKDESVQMKEGSAVRVSQSWKLDLRANEKAGMEQPIRKRLL